MAMPNEVPATVIAEMLNRLRTVEGMMFEAGQRDMEAAKQNENNPAAKLAATTGATTWREAAFLLQGDLDRIEIDLADLGFQIKVDNELTVGREVAALFGEGPMREYDSE
jgi:hypothetical protein